MYHFFQSCTNSVIPISIFLKSCTKIKKLYSQRKKLCSFGTLCFGLKFICNGICSKMYNFFQSYTNSHIPISIFLQKLHNQRKSSIVLVHFALVLNSFAMAFVLKCTIFFQSCTNSVINISIFLKICTMLKKLYSQRKKLYRFGTL